VSEYGTDVLAVPESRGFGVTAWLVPAALAALALLAVILLSRRWRGGGGGETSTPAGAIDPEDARRLDADLAAFDR
jgi:hypothetical protein